MSRQSLIHTATSGLCLMAFAFLLPLVAAPPLKAQTVTVTDTGLKVNKKLFFENGKSALSSRSTKVIDAVAKALNDNPRFTTVRIEGHTDSRGKPAANEALSLARAKAVREALFQRGVDGGRLKTAGFGGTRPLTSNLSAAGRAKNRRVVFNIQGIRGKRPPLAKISARVNDVQARQPEVEDWKDAPVGTGLYKLWRVQSREKSSADVTFRDASRIHLREDTLVIVYGATTQKARRFTSVAELERGALRTRLDELAGGGDGVMVRTPNSEAVFKDGRGLVSVENEETIVANHGGQNVVVNGRGKSKKSVKVKDNYGSKVKKNRPPAKPRRLPNAPKWTQAPPPVFGTPSDKATVYGAWSAVPKAGEYRVEVVRVSDDVVVAAATVPAKIKKFEIQNIEVGEYRARLSTIDVERFESKPGKDAVFSVAKIESEGGVKGAFYPGTKLIAPEGAECSVDGAAFKKAVAIERSGQTTVQCRKGKTMWAELPLKVMALQVQPRAALRAYRNKATKATFTLPGGFVEKGFALKTPNALTAGPAAIEGNALVFDVTGKEAGVFNVEVQRNGVTVGKAPITVVAGDTQGPTLEGLSVDNNVISVEARDESGIESVTLYAREAGEENYQEKRATLSEGHSYSATFEELDGSAEVYVKAEDKGANESLLGSALSPLEFDQRHNSAWGILPIGLGFGSLVTSGFYYADMRRVDREIENIDALAENSTTSPDTEAYRERLEEAKSIDLIVVASSAALGTVLLITGAVIAATGRGVE